MRREARGGCYLAREKGEMSLWWSVARLFFSLRRLFAGRIAFLMVLCFLFLLTPTWPLVRTCNSVTSVTPFLRRWNFLISNRFSGVASFISKIWFLALSASFFLQLQC